MHSNCLKQILFHFGAYLVVGINCLGIGLISPIEVVEEFGCYDSEIRLTCRGSHLDTKVAILEATFTPNCTQEDCFRVDLKRLARAYSPQNKRNEKTSAIRNAETEAGRKFLETLRKTNPSEDYYDSEAAAVVEKDYDGFIDDNDEGPKADQLISQKRKRGSLRASLQRLIIKYLRKLSPHEDYDQIVVRRSVRDAVEDIDDKSTDSEPKRIMLGVRNIAIDGEYDDDDFLNQMKDEGREDRYHQISKTRSYCPDQRRKIDAFDRFHIESALQNETHEEHNIRRILNRRCSGKNHCSFLFAVDHPLAVLWESGIVRVKYMCMEGFRINHYCNERLIIGNEIIPRTRNVRPTKGEPIAEARVQTREPGYHSLKIIKNSAEKLDPEHPDSGGSEFKRKKLKNPNAPATGVYSQDFRLLKILPPNKDSKKIEKIYFRKEDDIFSSTQTTLSITEESSVKHLTGNSSPSSHTGKEENIQQKLHKENILISQNELDDSSILDSDISKFENITLIIREGDEYYVTFPKSKQQENLPVNNLQSFNVPATTATTETSTTSTIIQNLPISDTITTLEVVSTTPTIEDLLKTSPSSIFMKPSTIPTSNEIDDVKNSWDDFVLNRNPNILDSSNEDMDVDEDANAHNGGDIITKPYELLENEIEVIPTNFYTASTFKQEIDEENRLIQIDNHFLSNNDEDISYKDEDDGDDDDDTNTRRTYKSSQKSLPRRPLLQGFIMSPGYPQFYVGDSECKTNITAPAGQNIRLTILDLSLRHGNGKSCKDYLRIVDLNGGRKLFDSCTELIKPLAVISESNKIEITFKTRTKFAFPKRGLLIHYTAFGCLTPSPPMNGRLVERKERTVVFECEDDFVFPDTDAARRQLVCINHSWDRVLPDCSSEKLASAADTNKLGMTLSKTEVMKDADIVYDIIIPSVLIAGLFLVNGIIFFLIMMFRRKRQNLDAGESKELAEL